MGLIALGATSALLLAACGSGDGSLGTSSSASSSAAGGGSGSGAMTPLTVGVIPIIDVAPIYLGVDQGFFKDEGLDVKLELAQGGAAIVPAVVSGQYQFGFSNTTSLLLATAKGLPLKAVASGNQATDDPAKDFGGVVVKQDSPIKSPKDLAGKKVGVNNLNNIMTTTINKWVRDDGGDPSTIQYTELPFPDMAAAVAKGDIDAGQVVEPFLTIAKSQGERYLGSNLAGVEPGMQIALYFTSASYVQEHGDIVKKFTAAMNKSLDYAQAHQDETRAILPKYTKLDAKAQQAVTLPKWTSEINTDSVQLLADLGTQDGLFTKKVDVSTLLP
ncbi:ABC transporter substrate-binding protein [Phycicoccus duodecadis]|uniref:ABC transporter substrate-binding protein n=1 Tax=Phycicoccus duodecadis TaxID=173053 RepID=UPI001FECED26|nr:ABC transporter substrate-binding protein [Phycicoccus duodecadis]